MNEEIIKNINTLISSKEFSQAKELLKEEETQNPEDFYIQKNLRLCDVN